MRENTGAEARGLVQAPAHVPPVTVDPLRCVACPKCIDSCRFDAILLTNRRAQILANCTGCGACISACPRDAIAKVEEVYPWAWWAKPSRLA